MVFKNILSNKFEFKRGNTIASFAEVFGQLNESMIRDEYNVNAPYDFVTGKQQILNPFENFPTQPQNVDSFYHSLVLCCEKLVPFYRFYF